MQNLLISIIIGLVAAIIDVIPMIIKKLDKMFICSAFLFWIIVAIFISHAQFISIAWLNGIIVAILVFLPLSFLIFKLDQDAIFLVLATNVVLGAIVGGVSGFLIS